MRPQSYEEALDQLVVYLHERERIRLAKLSGKPRPWTSDPILREFKFTNVLRENDRTTQWGQKNWFKPAVAEGAKDTIVLLNCGIFRFFGTMAFAAELGFQRDFDADRLKRTAFAMERAGKKVFTSAYVITNGGHRCPKRDVVADVFLTDLNNNLEYVLGDRENLFSRYAKRLSGIQGFGGTGFMAKEVLSDLHLSGAVQPFTDRYEWTPIGPGAQRGLQWMFPKSVIPKGVKAIPLLITIGKDLSTRLEPWMPQFGNDLDLHGIQFAMCEIDKYFRTKYAGGKPKNTYTPWSPA